MLEVGTNQEKLLHVLDSVTCTLPFAKSATSHCEGFQFRAWPARRSSVSDAIRECIDVDNAISRHLASSNLHASIRKHASMNLIVDCHLDVFAPEKTCSGKIRLDFVPTTTVQMGSKDSLVRRVYGK